MKRPAAVDMTDRPDRHGVMRGEWVDPDDIRPSARRTARTIAGWRTYCPLRRMRGGNNSGISEAHIIAADMLREAADVATLGYSSERPMLFVSLTAQPRTGMTKADMARNTATRDLLRALRPFTRPQRYLLTAVILQNETLNAWCRRMNEDSEIRFDPAVEKGKLIAVLDVLAKFYDGEIRDDRMNGRRILS